MRYLRTQVLNRRSPQDQRLYVDVNNAVVMKTPNNLTLPVGTTAQRPVNPANGMIRYNTDITTGGQVEVYQSGTWRNLRFNEPGKIVQQTLGIGDGENVYFGPISPSPASYTSTQSNMTWDLVQIAKNMLVIVENVIQLSNTNYTVVQNPIINAETDTAYTSVPASNGSTTLYFSTSIYGSSASGNGTYVTILFEQQDSVPFAVGETVVIAGFSPSGYNGTFTIYSATDSQVVVTSNFNSTMLVAGTITSNYAQYPAVNLTGASVSGSYIDSGTTVVSYKTDSSTGALTSINLSKPTISGTMAAGTAITIHENSQSGNGYYVYFTSPVPFGKAVTVLIGFDQ